MVRGVVASCRSRLTVADVWRAGGPVCEPEQRMLQHSSLLHAEYRMSITSDVQKRNGGKKGKLATNI